MTSYTQRRKEAIELEKFAREQSGHATSPCELVLESRCVTIAVFAVSAGADRYCVSVTTPDEGKWKNTNHYFKNLQACLSLIMKRLN